MFVVTMFADVVVVVIAADAMSVVVADAKLSEVTVETVVTVPDAIATEFDAPTGAAYAHPVAVVALSVAVMVPEVYAVAIALICKDPEH